MSPARHHPLLARLVLVRRLALRLLHLHSRALIWLAAVLMLVWGGTAAWLQWWFFPRIEQYRPALVAEFSQRVGRPIGVDALQGGWRAGKPYLAMQGLSLRSNEGVLALSLPRAEATLSWWPLLLGQLRFDRLAAISPRLSLSRAPDGIVRLAGLALNGGQGDDAIAQWLLRQHEIAIEDGELIWQDALRGAPALKLAALNIKLENQLFGRHRLQLSATPPAGLAAPLQAELNWRGDDPADWQQWPGRLQLDIAQLRLADWARWVELPFGAQRGQLEAQLRLDFRGLKVQALEGQLALQEARLQLQPTLRPLEIKQLAGRLRWQQRDAAHSLSLDGLRLALADGQQLNGAQATLEWSPQGGRLDAGGLNLRGLGELPASLPLPAVWQQRLLGWQPSGRFEQLNLRWHGDGRDAQAYQGRLAFSNLAWQAPRPWPSAGPLDGELNLDGQSGRLSLRGARTRIDAGEFFLAPLQFDQLRLALAWQHTAQGWQLKLGDLLLRNADLQAQASASWAWPGQGAGYLKLDGAVARLRAGAVADYLPTVLGRETLDWLKHSLVAGEARNARFTLDGALAQFPFADGRQGIWRVETETAGVQLDYAAGWPAVTGLDGKLSIVGNRLQVDASGRILGTRVPAVRALIPDLAMSTAVEIDGKVLGPTAEFFRFIAQSPLEQSLHGLGSLARAEGEGKLALQLQIPFEDADATTVQGQFQFQDNRLRIGSDMPPLSDLRGLLRFTERGLSAEGLSAHSLGGPLRADIRTEGEVVQIVATGRAEMRAAAEQYGLPLSERISGASSYRAQVSQPASGWQLQLDAPLQEVALDLPAPLGKAAGELRPLRLQLDAAERSERWQLALGNQLRARLLREPGAQGWALSRGEIRVGQGEPNMANRGLWLTVNLPELDLDPWLALQTQLESKPAAAETAASKATNPLSGVELRVDKLQLLGKQLDALSLRALPQAEAGWQLTASGKQVEGKLSWSPQAHGRLFARLSRLQLPLPAAPGAPNETADPASKPVLPAIDLVAEDFQFRQNSLGRLVLQAQQQRENWQIDSLSLINPDGQLLASGLWRDQGADSSTRIRLAVESGNVGKLLGRFGYPETVQRGSGRLNGELSWQGAPTSPDYPSLSGNLRLEAQNGQFAKIDPGMGRLLGILSLQSLPRRLSLDFRDVFSEGFAFDRIEGDSKIVRGVLTTDNLTIVGPAAQVLFRGEADVARETQQLRVRIVPVVGDSVAVGVGVALVNPIAAVGAFLLQRVLKDPLGRLIAYEYDISGKWNDPQIKRVGAASGK